MKGADEWSHWMHDGALRRSAMTSECKERTARSRDGEITGLLKEHTRMQQALVCEFSDPRLPCSLVEATLQLISSHHLSGRSSLSSKAALRVSARRLVAERKKIRYRWLSLG